MVQPIGMENWEELAELLERAMGQPAEQRVRFVIESTTDPMLRAEVLSLLDTGDLDYLERGVGIDVGTLVDPMIGAVVGNCRLERKLGEGGMGAVYEAVRTLELGTEQRVAVKIWHRSGLNAAEIRREAGMLARMEHPGIARLLDTGITATGQAFLVMELIEGQPLNLYAQDKTLEQRLTLIERLCEAIEAAHRALIAHRDIKPGNVLVTAEGLPKLIDFGISKSVEDESKTIDARMTPRYASPEQLRGKAITTATDIYSLGVTMYEVLSGTNPFASFSGPALIRAIQEGQPLKPPLPTELASIVLKAMAKDPRERYESALALREDLGRYRRKEPVQAVEATWGYRARKFVLRKRWSLTVGTLVVALVGLGFGRAYWEARQAALRFEQVRGLARSLLFEIHDEVSRVPGTLESRKLIVARALEYLDQLSRDPSADESLQRDLAESYMKVGNVQGTLVRSNESLGRFGDALVSYRKAESILERLHRQSPGDRELRFRLAKAMDGVGDACTRLQDGACSQEAYRKSHALYELDARQNPQDVMAQSRWLTSRITQLDPLLKTKAYAEMREELHAVAVAFEALGEKHPGEARLRSYQAYSYKRLGAMEGMLGHYDAGINWYRKAMALHRLAQDRFGESTCEVDIAWALEKQGKLAEANASLDRALALRRAHAAGRGNDQQSKLSLVSAMYRKAGLLQEEKHWAEAGALLEEASVIMKTIESNAKQNSQIGTMVQMVELMRGDSLWETGRRAEAKGAYLRGLAAGSEERLKEPIVERAQKRVSPTGSSGPATPSR